MSEDAFRAMLVRAVLDAEENLHRYDLSLVPGPHEPGCPCARGDCTMARIAKVREDAIAAGTWPTEEEWNRLQEAIGQRPDAEREPLREWWGD